MVYFSVVFNSFFFLSSTRLFVPASNEHRRPRRQPLSVSSVVLVQRFILPKFTAFVFFLVPGRASLLDNPNNPYVEDRDRTEQDPPRDPLLPPFAFLYKQIRQWDGQSRPRLLSCSSPLIPLSISLSVSSLLRALLFCALPVHVLLLFNATACTFILSVRRLLVPLESKYYSSRVPILARRHPIKGDSCEI